MLPDCEIVEAENGAGALAMFNEMEKLDLIFVDMDLGDMEGITLAGTAKRLFQTAKIIFATAYSQYAAKAYEMEIDDYILKPFDPARIRHVLEKCTGFKRKHRKQAERRVRAEYRENGETGRTQKRLDGRKRRKSLCFRKNSGHGKSRDPVPRY